MSFAPIALAGLGIYALGSTFDTVRTFAVPCAYGCSAPEPGIVEAPKARPVPPPRSPEQPLHLPAPPPPPPTEAPSPPPAPVAP